VGDAERLAVERQAITSSHLDDDTAALALDCSAGAQAAAAASLTAANETVRRQSWSITSATAEARHIARVAPAVHVEADDPTKVVVTNTPSHRADAGIAWGGLIHGLLEHAMRHPSATRDDLRRLAMWLTVDEQQLRPAIDHALGTVERVRRSDFWETARRSDVLVEVPFLVDDGSKRLASGVIDVMFSSPAGWHIVDYKTDVALDDTAYQSQLDAYSTALRRVRCEVAGASIVSVRGPSGHQE
jgi:ATP-dependent exoDNAse (exonuclease V) beta subunit